MSDVTIIDGKRYIGCRCGAHWWYIVTGQWMTITSAGPQPFKGRRPACCDARRFESPIDDTKP